MVSVTRQQIFAQAAKKLRQDFAELYTVPHNVLKGHEAEKLVRAFLSSHLPKRFGVGSGFIIDPRDAISKQEDVVIYDAYNCPLYRASDDAAIFPSENVAAVIEVKSSLDKQRLEEAFENISFAKSLGKTKLPEVPILMTAQTLGAIFAFESPLSLSTLLSHHAKLARSKTMGQHIDIILVLDRGVITFAGKVRGFGWAPMLFEGLGGATGEGAHLALSAYEAGEDSLDIFLRLLLAQLIPFRSMVGHPGFDWTKNPSGGNAIIEYLGSITHETDPKKREEKLKEYANEVLREFQAAGTPYVKPD
jgi:hypothetical protein